MKRIFLIATLIFLTVSAHADQTLRPDGMGGYILSEPPDFSMYGYEKSPAANMQRMELQRQQIENQRL